MPQYEFGTAGQMTTIILEMKETNVLAVVVSLTAQGFVSGERIHPTRRSQGGGKETFVLAPHVVTVSKYAD